MSWWETRTQASRYHCAMPAYSYTAMDANGSTQTGVLEADAPRAARSQLRAQQLVPLSLIHI